MWEYRAKAEKALAKSIKKTLDTTSVYKVPLVFGHLCSGVLDLPGALRISDIKVRSQTECYLKDLHGAGRLTHKEAFAKHIKIFGRIGTLLDWISLKAYIASAGEKNIKLKKYWVAFYIDDENDDIHIEEKRGSYCVVTISTSLLDCLVPRILLVEYLPYLYSTSLYQSPTIAKYLEGQLLAARQTAYNFLKKERLKKKINEISKLYRQIGTEKFRGLKDDILSWHFLGALQTGFMYTLSAGTNENRPVGFVSGIVIYCDKLSAHSLSSPLAMMSAVIPNLSDKDTLISNIFSALTSKYEGCLASFIKEINSLRTMPDPVVLERSSSHSWSRDIVENNLKSKLDVFASDLFPNWVKSAVFWLSLVTEWLRGAVHEGIPLNFCMVLADISQIKDSPIFEMVPLSDHHLASPWIKNGNCVNKVELILDKVRQQISKNNYSWFQDGRHALLWDATFPETEPKYLLKLIDSSWDVFVTNCRHGQEHGASKVAIVVTYVRADGSGGIIIQGKPILSFRHSNGWAGEYSETKKWLTNKFKQTGLRDAKNKESEVSKIVEACLAVSEDPHMGAMIIVLSGKNSSKDIPFDGMGTLWQTDAVKDLEKASVSELISLMAMDGATCIYRNNGDTTAKLAFRRLAKVSQDKMKKSLSDKTRELLDGEGSRKWSGALAACREDVTLVVSISQDGPILVFTPDKKKKVKVDKRG